MSKLREKLKAVEVPKTNDAGELHRAPKGGGPKRYGTMVSRMTPGEGAEKMAADLQGYADALALFLKVAQPHRLKGK